MNKIPSVYDTIVYEHSNSDLQLTYKILTDPDLNYKVVATMPGDMGYTIFKHGTYKQCIMYLDYLTIEEELYEIDEINRINELG